MKIKRTDTVLIITGKDRNKVGKVTKVIPAQRKIVVEGINIAKKHLKPTSANAKGGIIDITRPITISNAMVVCPHCAKATRVGYQDTEKGKIRICRLCEASLDQE